jgi:hypothetical protein
MLAINEMPDHIHFFIGMRPACCLADLVREVKKSSNEFIKDNKFCNGFHWQEGYGPFSYSHSHLSNLIRVSLKIKIIFKIHDIFAWYAARILVSAL